MNLKLSVQGQGGHTELSFTEGHVRATWMKTDMRERRTLKALIAGAKKRGMTAHKPDADGKPGEETKRLPGTFFNRKGELILKGDAAKVKELAKELLQHEIDNTPMVMELDSKTKTWSVVKKAEVKETKQEVVSTPAVSGG